MSLRTSMILAIFLVAAIATAVSVALAILTSYLHRTGQHVRDSLESVRIAEELEVDLLTHARATDPLLRDQKARELRANLAVIARYVTSEEEARLVEVAGHRIEEYLAAEDGTPWLPPAFAALEQVLERNVADAERGMAEAEAWDRMGTILGGGSALALVLGALALILWLRRSAFRPVFRLQGVMIAHASGRRDARVEESGPAEFRDIARRFNEMAEALQREHQNRLAFLAGVVHDLKNPITAAQLNLATMRPGRALPPEDQLRDTIQMLKRQMERLHRMVGDLLDSARIEAGQLEFRMLETDLRPIVREVIDLFQTTSPRHTLVAALPDEPVAIRCDPARIAQVLTNLVSNAIKYSPDGGEVRVSLEPGAAISVQDRGMGIDAADVPRLFEPFRRVGRAAHDIPGAGLGLFASKKIVEGHGGTIEVESEPGKGSTFRVRLPA